MWALDSRVACLVDLSAPTVIRRGGSRVFGPMTHHAHIAALVAAVSCLAAAGCDDATEAPIPTFEAREVGPLHACADGSFDAAQINAELADYPELAAELGITEVRTCEEATAYFAAFSDYVESLPTEEEGRARDDDRPSDFRVAQADAINLTTGGVLRIPGCTGVLINERALITAAHCVDQYSPNGERNFWKTDYTIRDFGSNEWTGTVRINVHPNYTGEGYGGDLDDGDDIAVVKLLEGSFGFPNAHRHRLYKGTMSAIGWMKAYGAGHALNAGGGAGTLRSMHYYPDWAGPYHFLMYADDPSRLCAGDSGGPVRDLTPANGYAAVAGLVTSIQVDDADVDKCTTDGGKQRAIRLQHKIRWIDDMLGGNDNDDCTTFHDGDWVYERCW